MCQEPSWELTRQRFASAPLHFGSFQGPKKCDHELKTG